MKTTIPDILYMILCGVVGFVCVTLVLLPVFAIIFLMFMLCSILF